MSTVTCRNCNEPVELNTGLIDEIHLQLMRGDKLIIMKPICSRICLQANESIYPCDACGKQLDILEDRMGYKTNKDNERVVIVQIFNDDMISRSSCILPRMISRFVKMLRAFPT